jgi:pimeloyl-ACP methyl ester carboxylesterase
LDLKDFALVGHSYGGTVAMAAYLAGDKDGLNAGIRPLVLLDAPCYPQSLPPFITLLRTPVLGHLTQFVASARFQASYSLSRIFQDKARLTPERINRYAKYYDLSGYKEALIICTKK